MLGKIKRAALAALAWAVGKGSPEMAVDALPVLPAPPYLRHPGKGGNRQPHRFSGVAAAKRAARKARRKAK